MRFGFAGLMVVLLASSFARCNDAAASVALGGIQFRREPRISMVTEKLFISVKKVRVEYEFLNESDRTITTEVAFPIPPYDAGEDFSAAGIRDFDDFKVWVDGRELKYSVEAKAMLNGRDFSETLQRFNVDVASLGHYDGTAQTPFSADFRKLSKSQQDTLTQAGLFDQDYHFPAWQVKKIYHWHQAFPPHRVVHVTHEYAPGYGFSLLERSKVDSAGDSKRVNAANIQSNRGLIDDSQMIESACVDPSLKKSLKQEPRSAVKGDDSDYISTAWVDYILTTANSWKTPIKNFELEIEKEDQGYVSFCWDGPVKKIDAHHFQAGARNFIPKRELRVVFFSR